MTCTAKHTLYQPTDDEWKCPNCKVGLKEGAGFVLEESEEGADESCEKTHPGDYLRCMECGHDIFGQEFADTLQKTHNLVPCPCCKGTGLVEGGAAPAKKSAKKPAKA